ncbi:hypothetical protein BH23ACT6_BH23ACT6_20220 [soil metagenome]
MTATVPDDLWRGTSDAHATAMARAQSSPSERLAWLEDSLTLAMSSGALPRDRQGRQQVADAWTSLHT